MILHMSDRQMNWFFHGSCDFGQLVPCLRDFSVSIEIFNDVLKQTCCIFSTLKSTECTVFARKIFLTKLEKNGHPLVLGEPNQVSSLQDLFLRLKEIQRFRLLVEVY